LPKRVVALPLSAYPFAVFKLRLQVWASELLAQDALASPQVLLFPALLLVARLVAQPMSL
jgi:hypothetical protein